MYPSTSIFIAIGQLAIVILVLFSYPLQVHPCRNCLDKVFHDGEHLIHHKPGDEDEDTDADAEDEFAPVEMSPLKHTLLTAGIIGAGFTIAYFVSDLQLGKIEYIFPVLCTFGLQMDHSLVFRRIDRVHNDILYSSGPLFLEGDLLTTSVVPEALILFYPQLTRDDASVSRTLNRAALALAIYGGLVFVFW